MSEKKLYLAMWLAMVLLCGAMGIGACGDPPGPTENTTSDASERQPAEIPDTTTETKREVVTDSPQKELVPESPGEAAADSLPPDGQAQSIEAICGRIAKVTCAPLFACCSKLSLQFKDEAACQKALEDQCIQVGYQKEGPALKAGKLVFDPPQLAACEEAITAAGKLCQTASGVATTATCKQIFRDPANAGEPCKSELGGAYCAAGKGLCFPTPTGTNCLLYALSGEACTKAPCRPDLLCTKPGEPDGTCEAPLDAGKPCRISPQCKPDLACLNSVCAAQLPAGATCDNVAQCKSGLECDSRIKQCVSQVDEASPCEFPLHCKAGLICHGLKSGLICQTQGKQGEPCSKKEHCAAGLGCVQNSCTPLPTESEACTKQNGCTGALLCDLQTNKCAKAPGQDQPCIKGEVRCAEGFGCFTTNQGEQCLPRRMANEACEGPDSCAAGLGCNDALQCEKLPAAGKTCLGGFLCAEGHFCDLNRTTCALYLKAGEPCPIGLECGPQQACIPDDNMVKRCAPIPGQKQPCTLTCSAGLACRPGLVAGTCIPSICNGALQE